MTEATGIMALATLLSRIAGLARDVVVARIFGAGFATDAFFMAFTIPNLLRRFFAEGSLTAAFVPTFTDVLTRQGADEARQVARICVTLLLLVMLGVVTLGLLASPLVVKVIGYGFAGVAGKLSLTDLLNRIMFPYILLISMVALYAGILNVRGHFFIPALSPVILNLAMIGCSLLLAPHLQQPILALAIGVLIGGLAQLIMQIPVLHRHGYDLRLDFHFRHPAVTKVARLMLPGIAGVAIYQINVLVTRLLASFLEEGSVSWLYYGQRLFEFPQGVFVVSLAQAVLPTMSRQQAAGDEEGFRQSLKFAMTLIILVTIPAAVGLVLCSEAVYSLFFMYGEFSAADVSQAARALSWYAPGLLFVGVSRVVAPSFYALKDTRTPVVVSFWTLLVNAVLGYLLMQVMGHVGLALALTLSAVFNAGVLVWLLDRRLGDLRFATLFRLLPRLAPGLLGMLLVVTLLLDQTEWLNEGAFAWRAVLLGSAVCAGGGIYILCAWLFGVDEIRQALQMLMRRLTRNASGGRHE